MADLFPETVAAPAKKWLPTDYQDESIPPPLPSPDGWIIEIDSTFYLRSADEPDKPDWNHPLSDGQIVLFDWTAVLAKGTVTMKPDAEDNLQAELDITHPTAPEGADLIMWEPGDADTVTMHLDDFTQGWSEGDEGDVQFYVWSKASTPFTFQSGKFLPPESPTTDAA